MPILIWVLLCACVVSDATADERFVNKTETLVLLKEFPFAKCLDGSPSGFYFQEAAETADRSKFMIVLEGGGMCTHESDCSARAKTDLGSSTKWKKTFNWDAWSLTTSDKRNRFRGWNKVWVKYCDGSIWSGARTTNLSNDTFGLWFAGHHTVAATLEKLSAMTTLNSSSFIAFAGGSAGGLGVFINVHYVQERLPHATVVGVPVGGYVPSIVWYTGVKNTGPPVVDVRDQAFVHHRQLYEAYLPKPCSVKLGMKQGYQCMIPRLSYPFTEQPMFVIEALTDSIVTTGFEAVPEDFLFYPQPVKTFLSEYGRNASSNFAQVLHNSRDGVFAASCFLHCHFTLDRPLVNGTNVIDALYSWTLQYMGKSDSAHLSHNGDFNWIDRCPNDQYWPPCNKHCPLLPN